MKAGDLLLALLMDIKHKLIYFAIDLILPIAIGYLCKYQKRLGENFFNKLILNNILVVYPALSMLSFWVLPLKADLVWLPVLGLAMGVIPGVIAYFIAERKYNSDLDRGSYVMSAILSNLGTIGGLCVFLLYGETGYAYQQLVVLFQYILMFMFCYPLAQYYYQKSQKGKVENKISVKAVLFSRNQLAVVGIMCGVALQAANVERPELLGMIFNPLVHFGAWTALIPVGYSVDFGKLREQYRSIIDLIPLKFIVTPVITYSLARLVISDPIMLNSILVLSCTPTAVNAVITSRIYGLNLHISVAAFILTTLIFLMVIYPILFFSLSV
ncbi:AEC family transporter [Dendrosporobacter sp. 1207_IL3150]|uniref:AEC family transporter n=1 Tax=Dendrosporobacter sp. 1207_IL3150 TaxID=3084054 RepID=UPI002FDB841F